MTCIAGVAHDGKVYIGGDSAGSDGWDITIRADRKVFRNGEFLFGFTDSFRMGQLLRYSLTPPDHPTRLDVETYLSTCFINAVRTCLKDGGFASKEQEVERGGSFLLGYRGRLFVVHGDYQVGEPARGEYAIGSGGEIARGALFAIPADMPPADRVTLALGAAAELTAHVRSPFYVESA